MAEKELKLTEIRTGWTPIGPTNTVDTAVEKRPLPYFEVTVKGDPGIGLEWYKLYIYLFLNPERFKELESPMAHMYARELCLFIEKPWLATSPITQIIQGYELSQDEFVTLQESFYPKGKPAKSIDPGVIKYFGNILKNVLEGAGYEVSLEVPAYYFPSPVEAGFLAPVFSHGTGQRPRFQPEVTEGYHTTLTYMSYEKPKSQVKVQYSFLDSIPEERLEQIERTLKESLTPYGLLCMLVVLEGCARNMRTNSFTLDINRALNVLGKKRDKKGRHYTRSKDNLIRTLEHLTKVNINFETRMSISGKKGKEEVTRFNSPIVSLNGTFEKYIVDEGQPIETGKKVQDGVVIHFHPEIYKFIESRYTAVPYGLLKTDTRKRGNAVKLYFYIMNQWRIGLYQYRGIIKQPMGQILDGAGLSKRLPKKKSLRKAFIGRTKEDLQWLRMQGWWIKAVSFDTANRHPFDPIVTIEMAENHPLKEGIAKLPAR